MLRPGYSNSKQDQQSGDTKSSSSELLGQKILATNILMNQTKRHVVLKIFKATSTIRFKYTDTFFQNFTLITISYGKSYIRGNYSKALYKKTLSKSFFGDVIGL